MDAADRSQMLQMLAESRDKLIGAAAGVSDEHAKVRPAEGRWSILECVEHVGFVEKGLFALLTTQLTPSAGAGDRSREELFVRGATNRNRKVAAPERTIPVGRFATLAEALDDFREKRGRTIAYVEECAEDLRACAIQHPVIGPCTGQEFLILLALHPARHAEQIREARAALGLAAIC